GAWWRPGARAVLVDPRTSKHIVVTSATRLLRLGGRGVPNGSGLHHQGGSADLQAGAANFGAASPRHIPQLPPAPQFGVRPVPPSPGSDVDGYGGLPYAATMAQPAYYGPPPSSYPPATLPPPSPPQLRPSTLPPSQARPFAPVHLPPRPRTRSD